MVADSTPVEVDVIILDACLLREFSNFDILDARWNLNMFLWPMISKKKIPVLRYIVRTESSSSSTPLCSLGMKLHLHGFTLQVLQSCAFVLIIQSLWHSFVHFRSQFPLPDSTSVYMNWALFQVRSDESMKIQIPEYRDWCAVKSQKNCLDFNFF